jgi:hypothetical protein
VETSFHKQPTIDLLVQHFGFKHNDLVARFKPNQLRKLLLDKAYENGYQGPKEFYKVKEFLERQRSEKIEKERLEKLFNLVRVVALH